MRILGKAWIVQLELLPRFLDELLQVGWGDGERGALRLDVGLFDARPGSAEGIGLGDGLGNDLPPLISHQIP